MRTLLALALLLVAVPAQAAETAESIGARLDMTSFNNSIGPRWDDGLHTLADYGFTQIEANGATASFTDPEDPWVYTITLLEPKDGKTRICIRDQAQNGGSYDRQNAYELVEGADGRLHATANRVNDPTCVVPAE